MAQQRLTLVALRLLALSLLLWTEVAFSYPFETRSIPYAGYVYRQGLVLDDNDLPMFAEYDPESGEFANLVPELDASDKSLVFRNGAEYKASREGLMAWKDNLPDGWFDQYLEVVAVEDFDASAYPTEFQQYIGQPYESSTSLIVYKPDMLDSTVSLTAGNGIIVQQSVFSIDQLLNDAGPGDARSLVLNSRGEVVYSSEKNLGYRVAYFDPAVIEEGENERTTTELSDGVLESNDDGIKEAFLAPLKGVRIYNHLASGGMQITAKDGTFLTYSDVPICWASAVDFTVNVAVELPYRTFNPLRGGSLHKFFVWSGYPFSCHGLGFIAPSSLIEAMTYVQAIGILAATATTTYRMNIPVDVTRISGKFVLRNAPKEDPIPITDTTVKLSEPREQQEYELPKNPDFNLDGQTDHVSALESIPHPEGTPDDAAPLYGVWFSLPEEPHLDENDVPHTASSAEGGEPIPPDLVRAAIQAQNFDNIGLVESLSFDDLADTDIYVFRESSGKLIIEKSPFLDPDANVDIKELERGNMMDGITEAGVPFFEVSIPGRDGHRLFRHVFNSEENEDEVKRELGDNKDIHYNAWQATQFIEKDFRGDTDSLRVGEPVRVVVVNRATGYIGSTTTAIQYTNEHLGRYGIELGEISLYPPNLKVSVERHYKVESGLTKDDDRHYQVGSEGAALHSDQYVKVTTDWRDWDGSPLPAELPGYTGRLASLVGDGQFDSTIDHFEIKPGLHTEVLKLPQALGGATAAHQYVHVVADKAVDTAGFGASLATRNRPEKYVPIRVAVYDADASQALKLAQLEYEQNNDDANKPKQDSSVYQWPFRPEMMYSVYDLDVSEIIRTPEGEDAEPVDITDSETPTLVSSDQSLEIVHDLIASEYDPLEYFGPDSDLVYSLEGYQQVVYEGEGTSYSYSDFGHLGALEADDLLSLNLLNSQDEGNVLWEWAFQYLYIATTDDSSFNELAEDAYYVTADNPVVNLSAGTIGSGIDENGDPRTVGILWTVEGDGELQQGLTQEKGESRYTNTLTMSKEAGSRATVFAQLVDDSDTKVSFGEVLVLPGAPAHVELSERGTVGLNGTASMIVEAKVRDAFGNNVQDGTPVGFEAVGFGDFEQSLGHTIEGVASAKLVGGFEASTSGVYEVDAGDVVSTGSYSVIAPTLEVSGFPDQAILNQIYPITITVRNAAGEPAENSFVSISVSEGVLDYVGKNFLTNASGQINVHWFSGGSLFDSAQVSVRVGAEQLYLKSISAIDSGPSGQSLSVSATGANALLVGDREAAATIPYQGVVSSNAGSLDYAVKDTLTITRNTPIAGQNNSVTLNLGSFEKPNRSPLFALEGEGVTSYLSRDDTGLAPIDATRVSRVQSHPEQFGYSLGFNKSAGGASSGSELKAEIESIDAHFLANFSMQAKETGGSILRLGTSVSVELLANATVVLNVALEGSGDPLQLSAVSAPVVLDQWARVSVAVDNTEISLWLNGERVSVPVPPTRTIAGGFDELTWGKDFTGNLAQMAVYDLDSEPLVLFGNGSESTDVAINVGESVQIEVISQNKLKHNEALGRLRGQRVGLYSEDFASDIDVIPAMEYARTGSLLRDTLDANLSWDDFASVYSARVTHSRRPLLEHVLAERLNTDRNGYVQLDSTTALMALLKSQPQSRELDDTLSVVLDYYTGRQQNSHMMAAASQHLFRHMEPLLRGASVDIDALAVPLNVFAELIDVSPRAAIQLGETIQSESDFKTWLALFSLPAEGWIGLHPPIPSHGVACSDDIPTLGEEGSLTEMPILACPITGDIAADVVNRLWDEYSAAGVPVTSIPTRVKHLLSSLPLSNSFWRKNLFKSLSGFETNAKGFSLIKTANAAAPLVAGRVINVLLHPVKAIKSGIKATPAGVVKEALDGYIVGSNSRIHPFLMAAASYYLWERIFTDCSGSSPCDKIELKNSNSDPEEIFLSLLAKAAAAPTGLLSGSEISDEGEISCLVGADGHGANFELWATTLFHARSEQLGQKEYTITGMQERQLQGIRRLKSDPYVKVADWDRLDADQNNLRKADIYERYADLKLQGDESQPEGVIVELKSYAATKADHDERTGAGKYIVPESSMNSKFPLWDASVNTSKSGTLTPKTKKIRQARTTVHRQILLDAMLSRLQLHEKTKKEVEKASDFLWYFQDWRVQTEKDKTGSTTVTKINTNVGVSVADVRTKSRSTVSNDSGLTFIKKRLSALGSGKAPGHKLVAYNLGLDSKRAGAKKKEVLLYDTGANGNSPDGGLQERIKSFPVFGDITGEDKLTLLRDVFGIDPQSDIGTYILTGQYEDLDNLLEKMDELQEEIGLTDVQDKIAKAEKWFGEKIEKAKDKLTPDAYRELKKNLKGQIDRMSEELNELYQDGQSYVESVVNEKLGLELQCL